jgi:hypothetical protein
MPTASGPGQRMLPFADFSGDLSALRDEVDRLRAENERLLRLPELSPREAAPPGPVQTGIFERSPGPVHADSSAAATVAFFTALFAARPDVYALRWENTRSGKAGGCRPVRGGWRKGVPAEKREVPAADRRGDPRPPLREAGTPALPAPGRRPLLVAGRGLRHVQ